MLIYVHRCIYVINVVPFISISAKSAEETVEYAGCISAEGLAKPPNQFPGYDIKSFDSEASVLGLWVIWSTSSSQLIPGPLWTEMVVLVSVQFVNQIEICNNFLNLKPLKWLIYLIYLSRSIHIYLSFFISTYLHISVCCIYLFQSVDR